ncbi:hypothetical protein AB9K41_08815 [Cribrihabitans sp. XS_ASV171]
MASNTADGVLMLRDGEIWTRAGYADATWREKAAQILAKGAGWEQDPQARLAFFAALLHDEDPFVRHVATDELSRAPYDAIRAMTRPVTGEVAQRALADKAQIPWRGFFILMLGLSDRPEDRALVRDRIAAAQRYGGVGELDAWATALVEIYGAAGVERLATGWFDRPDSSTEELRAVISALAAHGRYGDPALRPRILEVLAAVPSLRPDVVGSVATALARIGDFTRAHAIRSAVSRAPGKMPVRIDPAELFAASSYVYQARQTGIVTASSEQENRK